MAVLLENNCRSNFETLDQGDGVRSDTLNVLHGDRAVRRRFSEPMRKQPISEEVMQLLELDVARSRFVQTDTERKELLELLTLWLYMLPKGGEYRQGADTLAAICYRVFSSLKKTETGARMMLMTCRKFIPAYFTDGKNNKYLEQRLCLFSSLLCFWDPQSSFAPKDGWCLACHVFCAMVCYLVWGYLATRESVVFMGCAFRHRARFFSFRRNHYCFALYKSCKTSDI